jgi:hypothetical protein
MTEITRTRIQTSSPGGSRGLGASAADAGKRWLRGAGATATILTLWTAPAAALEVVEPSLAVTTFSAAPAYSVALPGTGAPSYGSHIYMLARSVSPRIDDLVEFAADGTELARGIVAIDGGVLKFGGGAYADRLFAAAFPLPDAVPDGIYEIRPDRTVALFSALGGGNPDPRGMAFGRGGPWSDFMYVANPSAGSNDARANRAIVRLDSSGAIVDQLATHPDGPWYLAMPDDISRPDYGDYLYFTLLSSNRVMRVDAAGNVDTFATFTAEETPIDLVFGRGGALGHALYVTVNHTSGFASRRLVRLLPDGSAETVGTGLRGFTLAVDPDSGDLFLADEAGGILRIGATDCDANDAGTLRFIAAESSVGESDGTIEIDVARTCGSAGAVSVDYLITPANAVPGVDYRHPTGTGTPQTDTGTLTFGDGVDARSIAFEALDNDSIDGTRRFTIDLLAPTGGAALGDPARVTVSILDDDVGADLSVVNLLFEPLSGGIATFPGLGAGFNDLRYRYRVVAVVRNNGPAAVANFSFELDVPKDHLAAFGQAPGSTCRVVTPDPPDPVFVRVVCDGLSLDPGESMRLPGDAAPFYAGYAARVPRQRAFEYRARVQSVGASVRDPSAGNDARSESLTPRPGSGSGGGGSVSPEWLVLLGLLALLCERGQRRVRRAAGRAMTLKDWLHNGATTLLFAWALSSPGLASSQTVVTTTADLPPDAADCVTPGSTTCSLRAAIARAAISRNVHFNIPGAGPHLIRLDPALGSLVANGIGIDGLTQPGAGLRPGAPEFQAGSYDLRIGIAGPSDGALDGPLLIYSNPSGLGLRGIAFLDHEGVGLRATDSTVVACYFNTLDGINPGTRRLSTGVELFPRGRGSVESSVFLGPRTGIEVKDGRTPLSSQNASAFLANNYFGTDRTGLVARSVEYGVLAQIDTEPPFNVIARPVTVTIRSSLFVLAERHAIRLRGVVPFIGDDGSPVRIGYRSDDVAVLGPPPATQGAGILLEGPNHSGLPGVFGGGGSISGVRVQGQRGAGLQLDDTHGPITGVRFGDAPGTSLYANLLGLSLNPAAPGTPTPNDPLDADGGPNGRQNYPVLESIQRVLDDDGVTERVDLRVTLQSKPNGAYHLTFFANPQCNASGHGEGQHRLVAADDYVRTDAVGQFSGVIRLPADGAWVVPILQEKPFVTAIATDVSGFETGEPTEETGSTSEFSACLDSRPLPPPGQRFQLTESQYQGREGETAQVTVRRAGDLTSASTVRFQTSDGSAIAGRDYTSYDSVLEFEAGRRELNVLIALRAQDSEPQPLRDFFVTLLSPTGGPILDPDRFVARVVVLDDDIRFSVTDTVGDERDRQMDFGAVEFGDFVEGTVTITNTGEPTVYFDSIEFIRSPADDRFREVGRTCGRFLDAGESCTITVRFEPGDLPDAGRVVANGQLAITPDAGPAVAVSILGEAPPRANLFVSIEGTPVNPDPSGVVEFTVTAGNGGPAEAAEGVVRFTAPADLLLSAGSLSPSAGRVAVDASTVTWSLGPMASGQSETLSYNATVDPATPRGTEITSTASIELVDPRRFDAGDNTSSFTIAVGSAAADLRIVADSVSFWFAEDPDNVARSTTIPIAPICRLEIERCLDEVKDRRWLRMTVANLGPDAPEGPVLLRLTTGGLCFSPGYVSTSPTEHRRRCHHGEIYELPIDPARLAPGSSLLIEQQVWAVSGPTGHTKVGVEILHSTFDPNHLNNTEVSSQVQIVIPLPKSSTGEMCFIATAAYGSWLDPHVVTLRAFRDRWLLTNAPGRLFVGWYYSVSPPLANWIAERVWARGAARGLLAPIVLTIEHPARAGGLLLLLLAAVPIGRRVGVALRSSRS